MYSSNPAWLPEAVTPQNTSKTWVHYLRVFASGILLPLGFAPFHLPGLAILSLTFLFLQLINQPPKKALITGLTFGLAAFSLGTSWVYASIHTYGHLNPALSALITLLFTAFLSFYTGLFSLFYTLINRTLPIYLSPFLFSSLWFFSEYFRSIVLGGFPWLLLGFGQMDSPLQHLLPLIGVFGVSGLVALSAGFLALGVNKKNPQKIKWLILFILTLTLPTALNHTTWTQAHHEPISVAIVQADLSMRDKWNSALYQKIQSFYQQTTTQLMPKKDLIVLPESAIPLPTSYANTFLQTLQNEAKANQSAVILGIPHPSQTQLGTYHNALLALGHANGIYFKQHLVPFGEYIPKPFSTLTQSLGLPTPNMTPGNTQQPPITFNQQTIATLICYELAYPDLLRAQLPSAAFIVSISDDGWFGHSLAVYQQLQMAQALSKQTGRAQIVSNNDGLSSLINSKGQITDSLPAFSKGTLEGKIYPATGATPWVKNGNAPIIVLNTLILLLIIGCRLMLAAKQKRRYPNQPS